MDGAASALPKLHEIETWVFDLDNTLYPGSCRLFAEIENPDDRFHRR